MPCGSRGKSINGGVKGVSWVWKAAFKFCQNEVARERNVRACIICGVSVLFSCVKLLSLVLRFSRRWLRIGSCWFQVLFPCEDLTFFLKENFVNSRSRQSDPTDRHHVWFLCFGISLTLLTSRNIFWCLFWCFLFGLFCLHACARQSVRRRHLQVQVWEQPEIPWVASGEFSRRLKSWAYLPVKGKKFVPACNTSCFHQVLRLSSSPAKGIYMWALPSSSCKASSTNVIIAVFVCVHILNALCHKVWKTRLQWFIRNPFVSRPIVTGSQFLFLKNFAVFLSNFMKINTFLYAAQFPICVHISSSRFHVFTRGKRRMPLPRWPSFSFKASRSILRTKRNQERRYPAKVCIDSQNVAPQDNQKVEIHLKIKQNMDQEGFWLVTDLVKQRHRMCTQCHDARLVWLHTARCLQPRHGADASHQDTSPCNYPAMPHQPDHPPVNCSREEPGAAAERSGCGVGSDKVQKQTKSKRVCTKALGYDGFWRNANSSKAQLHLHEAQCTASRSNSSKVLSPSQRQCDR